MSVEISNELPPGIKSYEQFSRTVVRHRFYQSGEFRTNKGKVKIERALIKTNSRIGVNRTNSINGYDPTKERELLVERAVLEDLLCHW